MYLEELLVRLAEFYLSTDLYQILTFTKERNSITKTKTKISMNVELFRLHTKGIFFQQGT